MDKLTDAEKLTIEKALDLYKLELIEYQKSVPPQFRLTDEFIVRQFLALEDKVWDQ